ncbi:Cytochrome c oxidase assembly protein CtaG [Plasmodiophora brassicae]|uniref:Cytochrome c oxidase assembly protein CtaG n=1 Tax=Plasmodiophora brassicae TaxID=37360 RepID=A0A0G4IT08_PLABS|nr:hypothetical protein PBRA_006602 [Plasmodiophora brassicae]SPQ95881.1 unnamed protein product [Plasmodiophora brassicae]
MTGSARRRSTAMYAAAMALGTLGLSYASVPLYRAFCQATGFGGTVQERVESKIRKLADRKEKPARFVTVEFNSDLGANMRWKFVPCQQRMQVQVGETALAFYKATNLTDRAITGVSSYNVTPMKAGLYFNKIQCFCFEEQRLRPHEEIELPVFFFLDPDLVDDRRMNDVKRITLSYTFFPVDEDDDDDDVDAARPPATAST